MTRISVVVACVMGLWACGDNGIAPPDASSCPAPFGLCGSTCTDIVNDTQNCGECGTVCPGGMLCSSGACTATCAVSEVECAGECISPETDPRYCGASADCSGANAGTQCPSGEACSAGQCSVTCVTGELVCGGRCIDPTTDNQFCGASTDCTGANVGMPCPSGSVCDGTGHCALSCDASRLECNAECIDPQTDVNFCGATDCAGGDVGTQCGPAEGCLAGVCEPYQCNVDLEVDYSGAPVTFQVPTTCGALTFTAAGAAGGSATTVGGNGASVTSTIAVTPGETLTIIVGGTPASGNGGGGGTFVLHADGSLVIAAGGGGGGAGNCCGNQIPGAPGVAAPNGTAGGGQEANPSDDGVGGVAGQGGGACSGQSTADSSGAGAGFLTDGANGIAGTNQDPTSVIGLGGADPADGAAGGGGFTSGGYGGGGGTGIFFTTNYPLGSGGGGGGYSGGGSGCNFSGWSSGGGGGSFNPGTSATGTDGVQIGNGVVTIKGN